MQINSIQTYNYQKKSQNPQFKSAYPVYHWVEKNGEKVVPIVTKSEIEKVQSKIVRMLNKTLSRKNPIKARIMDRFAELVAEGDRDYSIKPEVRSFYNATGGWKEKAFEAVTYLITGKDVAEFDNVYGKPLGKAKSISKTPTGKLCSLELEKARSNYEIKGLNFVKEQSELFVKDDKKTGLHIVYTPIYYQKGAKKGEVKEYSPKWVLFRPESGESNPFVKLGLVE